MKHNQFSRILPYAIWIWLMLCALPWRGLAAEYYVTPEGAGDYGGTNWDNAFSNVQEAATLATNVIDVIYLQQGIYSNAAQIVISNAAGVIFQGGCNGLLGGSSNGYSGTNSILTKTGGVMRIFYATNSVINMSGLTISGGFFANGGYGAGLYLAGGSATLSNCVVTSNTILTGVDASTDHNYGAGVYAMNTALELVDCVLSSNGLSSSRGVANGGAIWHGNSSLTLNRCRFIGNRATAGYVASCSGGALCASASTVLISGSDIETCYASGGGYGTLGGGVYLSGGTCAMNQCVFSNVYATGSGKVFGGAVYASGVSPLTMGGCAFSNCHASDNSSVLYLTGVTGAMNGCVMDAYGRSGNAKAVWLLGGSLVAASNLVVRNTPGSGIYVGASIFAARDSIFEAGGQGVYHSGGTLALTNCLVAASWGDGIYTGAGTATVVNCTLADNAGWGYNFAGGTGAVLNSIAWNNLSGGIMSNGLLPVNYSCSQNMPTGANNITNNPLFIYDYHLSAAGLPGQALDSPCVNSGFGDPTGYGLETRTTRTDGSNDSVVVDMGYHYPNGVATNLIPTSTVYYVNAGAGLDANDGLSYETAFKTLTNALAKIAQYGTIYVAAGTYGVVSEAFPLTVCRPHLALIGTNRATTVVDAGASASILSAPNKGTLSIGGMSFVNGRIGNGRGGGLYLPGCNLTMSDSLIGSCSIANGGYGAGLYLAGGSATLSNCVVTSNTILTGVDASTDHNYGAGVYAMNTALELVDCVLSSNGLSSSRGVANGGAIWHGNSSLTLNRCRFIGNRATAGYVASCSGGALCASASTVLISGSDIETCYASGGGYGTLGGGVYLSGGTCAMNQCVFSNVYATGSGKVFGGAVYASGVSPLTMGGCAFSNCHASDNSSVLYLTGVTGAMNGCVMDAYGRSGNAKAVWLLGGSLVAASNLVVRNTPGSGIYVGASIFAARDSIFEAGGQGVYHSGGTLALTNCLVMKNASNGVWVASGTATVVNCTIATNAGWGITNAGVLTVKNSIVWDNDLGGIATNAATAVTYTDSQELHAGPGNFSQGPLFVDPVAEDYHVMSLAGSWHGGVWMNDAQMSPCIDAGEPAPGSAYNLEPKPNGGRVNMGAYGNTVQASLSSRGTVIAIW